MENQISIDLGGNGEIFVNGKPYKSEETKIDGSAKLDPVLENFLGGSKKVTEPGEMDEIGVAVELFGGTRKDWARLHPNDLHDKIIRYYRNHPFPHNN